MKKLILAIVLFCNLISLDAKELTDKFDLSFTSIEIFYHELSPAFQLESKISDFICFTIVYANNLITKSLFERPVEIKNPKAQSLYLSMNYRF